MPEKVEVLVVGPSPRERLRVFQRLDNLQARELIRRPPREELDLRFRCFFWVTMCSAVLP